MVLLFVFNTTTESNGAHTFLDLHGLVETDRAEHRCDLDEEDTAVQGGKSDIL